MKCPASAIATLRDGHCSGCEGTWLDEAAIVARIARDLDIGHPGRSDLGCPVCQARLTGYLLFEVPIDRCAAHGLWFEKAELDEVIKRSQSDEWRLYGSSLAAPNGNPIGALIGMFQTWFRARAKPD